ncbi:DUF1559 domain-containing protein [Singulisphaera sp. PoT]|uniref:DUF1559 family PulG-like putative transporter n=1 Tax=Singulisphaera sp. PoT TaxID=3411797 RepID=UPI003BF4A656
MKRCGMTLIEMLVVISVVGVLAVLAIGAVGSAREESRRLQCVANLKQLAIAFHSYASHARVFPAAMAEVITPPGNGPRVAFSPFVPILPDLDRRPLYHALNLQAASSLAIVEIRNRTVASASLATFLCPSDGVGDPGRLGAMNYRANLGSGLGRTEGEVGVKNTGGFSAFAWLRPADFKDGLAETALLSEKLRGDGDDLNFDPRRDYWHAGLTRVRDMATDVAVARCSHLRDNPPPHFSRGGSSWVFADYYQTFYNHVIRPNSVVFDCTAAGPVTGAEGFVDAGIFASRSNHRGLINLATADGAVHAISGTIELRIWRSLGTRAGGEPVHESY